MPKFEIYYTRIFCSDEVAEVEAESREQAVAMIEADPEEHCLPFEPELTEQTPDIHVVQELTA